MKKLLAVSILLSALSFNAHAQLSANPWQKSTPPKPEPIVEVEPQTFDNNLPINPWQKSTPAKPTVPVKREIPKIDGLSINPIAPGENK